MIERKLTKEAQADRDEFNFTYMFSNGCSCHLHPPCGFCTHPGNPLNQADESCYEKDDSKVKMRNWKMP